MRPRVLPLHSHHMRWICHLPHSLPPRSHPLHRGPQQQRTIPEEQRRHQYRSQRCCRRVHRGASRRCDNSSRCVRWHSRIRCIIRTSVVMQYMTSLYDITHCMLAYSDVITCVTCFSAGPDNAPDPHSLLFPLLLLHLPHLLCALQLLHTRQLQLLRLLLQWLLPFNIRLSLS